MRVKHSLEPIVEGSRFGSLVVISKIDGSVVGGHGGFYCRCDCGLRVFVDGTRLRAGKDRCGKMCPGKKRKEETFAQR